MKNKFRDDNHVYLNPEPAVMHRSEGCSTVQIATAQIVRAHPNRETINAGSINVAPIECGYVEKKSGVNFAFRSLSKSLIQRIRSSTWAIDKTNRMVRIAAAGILTYGTLIAGTFGAVSCSLKGLGEHATTDGLSPDGGDGAVIAPVCSPFPLKGVTKKGVVSGDAVALFRMPIAGRGVGGLLVEQKGGIFLVTKGGDSFKLLDLKDNIRAASLGPDCRSLAVAVGSSVRIFDLAARGSAPKLAPKIKGMITSLSFAPDGRALLIGSVDGGVYRWRAPFPNELSITNREFERYIGHGSIPQALVYLANSKIFFSADWAGSIDGWLVYSADDPFDGLYDKDLFGATYFGNRANRMRVPQTERTGVDHLTLLKDGKYLIATLQNGIVEIWRVAGLVLEGETKLHSGVIYSIASSPSGERIVTSSRDGRVAVWHLQEKTATDPANLILDREFSERSVKSLAFLSEDEVMLGYENASPKIVAIK